jgi:PAS domain S-box-containing protein
MLKVTHLRSLFYSIAVITIALVMVLKLLLNALIEPESLLLFFLTAVVISAYYGGLKSGLLATALAILCRFYLLFPNSGFWTPNFVELLQLVLFAAQGGLISVLIGKLHLEKNKSESRFELASTAASFLIYDWDIQKNIVSRTQGLAHVLGYDPQEVEQSSNWWRERIHPDDQQLLSTEKSRVLADPNVEIFNIEYRVRHKQGFYIYVCDRGVICRNADGEAVRIVGFTLDINDYKQAQRELYRREQEFKALVENSPDIITRIDQELRHIYINPAIELATGLSPESFIGKTYAELGLSETECLWWRRLLEDVFTTAQEQVTEFEFPSPDGTIRYYQARIVPELAADSSVTSLLAVAREITKLKEIEAALRGSESKFRRLVESNIIGVIFWDTQGNIWDANDAFLQTVGYTREDLQNGRLNWKQMTPLEQRSWSDRPIEQMRLGMAATPLEKEYICKDGRRVPVLLGGVMFEGSRELGVSFALDLTLLRTTELALRESERRFRRLVESDIFGVVFANFQGGIYYANDYFLKMIGYDQEDLLQGRIRWDVITPPEYLHLDARAAVELKAFGIATQFEKEYIRKDGTRIPILLATTLLQEPNQEQQEIIGFILDLTQQKRVEREREQLLEELEKSLNQLEAVVGSMTEGLVIANPEGYVLSMNPAALRLHGLESVEEVHRRLWEFSDTFEVQDLDGGAIPMEEWPLARALRGEVFNNYEVRVQQLNTGRVWIGNYSGTPVRDASGQVVLAIVTARDVTEQKRSQAELAQSLKREQAARTEAEMANRLKDEFLAVLSHELRSPLNPILGWTKILQKGNLSAVATARALETIERNAKLQTQLIEDLLDVSRILRGKLSLNVSSVNLAETIEAALLTVRLAAQTKCIEIQTCFEENVGSVLGDSGRLQQVVWNLLSNAVKFTPRGGRVEVRLLSNQTAENSPDSVLLQVSDTGKGIKAEFLPYVFDYFRQENGATTRLFGGLGLGLAIVRHLVELHGGRVYAESLGEGEGATFTVKLPAATVCPRIAPQSQSVSVDLSGLQILVVDDEADMREFLVFLLEDYGAKVTVVTSAGEVLSTLKQLKPDLLISDIGMPEVDGYMLIRHW